MTSRENFLGMMGGGAWEWLPFDLPMTPPVEEELFRRKGTRSAVEAFDTDFCGVWPHHPGRREAWAEAHRSLGWEFGEDVRIGDEGYAERVPPAGSTGSAWHLTEMLHPLSRVTSVEQLASLPWRDPDDLSPYQGLAAQVEEVHARGKVAVFHCECTVFEHSWYARGMDCLFEDLVDGTVIAEWLLDHFARQSATAVREAALAGVDLIRLGDDVGTQHGMMMSVAQWRETLAGKLADVVRSAKEARPQNPPLIQYHSDGDVSAIVEDLIAMGIDLLNPVQPECMDLDEAASRWKDRLGFSGMIGTQTTMPFGTPDDVRAAVQKVRGWADRGARVICAPTHVLEPDVPWPNIEAFIEAVKP